MSSAPWRTNDNFLRLCDLVARGDLVCVTGAGISSVLFQKQNPSQKLPQWPQLLKSLLACFSSKLSSEDIQDCRRLLRIDPDPSDPPWPSGRELTMAASIIRAAQPADFDQAFRESITNTDNSFSETHTRLLDLDPAGILTFNYDSAHENAACDANVHLQPMTPSDEPMLREAVKHRRRPFYLKAHGSITSSDELVLTDESYRHLFVKSPAYRAFVQNVLTNFNLLFVGFKINDPDFDLFIDTMAREYGGPLHDHVALFHQDEKSANDVALRRRYGIHVLYVHDFGHIPRILGEAQSTAGPILNAQIGAALSKSHRDRQDAHAYFRALGSPGRKCASNCLIEKMKSLGDPSMVFELSEVAYSLGIVDARANKGTLFDIVDKATHADPVGRALTVLRPVIETSDLPRLQTWLAKIKRQPLDGTNPERIEKYLEYLMTYVPAKFAS